MDTCDMADDGEKRKAHRTKSIAQAKLVYGNGLYSVACTVRDMSETGAKLMLAPSVTIPDAFILEIPRKGISRAAHRRWRSGSDMGVEFESIHADEGPEALKAEVARLGAENAVLRRRVSEMALRLEAYGESERPLVA